MEAHAYRHLIQSGIVFLLSLHNQFDDSGNVNPNIPFLRHSFSLTDPSVCPLNPALLIKVDEERSMSLHQVHLITTLKPTKLAHNNSSLPCTPHFSLCINKIHRIYHLSILNTVSQFTYYQFPNNNKMTNFKLLPLFFSFFSILSATSSLNDANLIQQTCKHTPHQALCLQYLKSDPRSTDADISGLALIMVDAMKVKSKQALAKIHQQLRRRSLTDTEKQALSSCAEQYRAVLEADVPGAIAALQKGDPKFAEDGANDAALEANSCESGFSSGKSPLTQENNALHDVAQVTAAIVRNLL